MLAAQRRKAAGTATLGLLTVSVLITLLCSQSRLVRGALYIGLAVCAIPIWFLFYCGASSATGTDSPEVVPSGFQVLRGSASIGPVRPRPLR